MRGIGLHRHREYPKTKSSPEIMNNNNNNNDKRLNTGMTVLYLLLTVGGGIAIFANLISTQWVHGDEWRARGEKRVADVRSDPARRGNIYSSDGKVLATTVTECDLYLDLYDTILLDDKGRIRYGSDGTPMETGPIVDSNLNKYIDSACMMLHEAFPHKSAQYYRERIMNERKKVRPGRCFLVQRGVPYSVWTRISDLPGWKRGVVRSVDHQSVQHQVRAHIYGDMAGNVIGFRNERSSGTYTGLEGYYDSVLRGQDGLYNYHRLTMSTWLPDDPSAKGHVERRTDDDRIDTIMLRHRIDGSSIISTIDTRYQDIAESSLRKALHQYRGTAGCAILMEMQTGYVLACANLAYDTSIHDFREVRDRNVAVSDVYEPGSTFKTLLLSAMLSDPTIHIDTAMQVKVGYKDFGGKNGVIKDDHTLAGRDSLNVREVIEQSSNVGMCELGWMYFGERRDTLRHLVESMFPYGNMNPDLNAPEYRTYINDLHASKRDFLNFCYGYSTRVSAMQLITFYNALGADGRMVKPLFCRAIVDDNRTTEIKPVVLNPQICSRETARMVRSMLEGVVEHGTGNNIKNNTYGIAGKTGTAINYRTHLYNGSFAGFFPSENPRYTCLVVLENSPAYGRQAALVFKAIADCVVAVDKGLSDGSVKSVWPKLQDDSTMAQTRPYLLRGNQAEIRKLYKKLKMPYYSSDSSSVWVTYHEATDSTRAEYQPASMTEGKVPNCIGMTAKDAVAVLHSAGYKVRLGGYGKVASQSPRGGQQAKRGSTIEIILK